jgi:hypothetical protein
MRIVGKVLTVITLVNVINPTRRLAAVTYTLSGGRTNMTQTIRRAGVVGTASVLWSVQFVGPAADVVAK